MLHVAGVRWKPEIKRVENENYQQEKRNNSELTEADVTRCRLFVFLTRIKEKNVREKERKKRKKKQKCSLC